MDAMAMPLRFATAALSLAAADAWTYGAVRDWPTFNNHCGDSNGESPIDIVASRRSASSEGTAPLSFQGLPDSTTHMTIRDDLETNGHTWEVEWDTGHNASEGVIWQGKFYRLAQYHYHAPSEHTVHGAHFDMEAHHVHYCAGSNCLTSQHDDEILVVAVFLRVGAENPYLQSFWHDFGPAHFPITDLGNPYEDFLPESEAYYSYIGSTTTPPCVQNVQWVLMQESVTISQQQLTAYRASISGLPQTFPSETAPIGVAPGWDVLLGNNNRPLQALGVNRTISVYNGSPFEAWAATLDTPDCPSRVRRSRCIDSQFRGIVVFFHGYSACSEQVESVSEMLANSCLDVLAPTMPGHGHASVWCGEGGESCEVTCGNGNGWTHNTLPTHRSLYHEFARNAHYTIKQEVNFRAQQVHNSEFEVSLIGLSFGAPMTLYLALMGGSFYARQLLVNPYLALGDETIDQAKRECELLVPSGQKTYDQCETEAITGWLAPAGLPADSPVASWLGDEAGEVVRSLFTNLVKLSDAVGWSYQGRQEGEPDGTVAGLMEGDQEWGSVCNQNGTEGRGGFCKFKNKHLLSAHSFSLHTIVDAQRRGAWSDGVPTTQIMLTERDGKTRNGLSFDMAQNLHGRSPQGVSVCMHKFQHGTDRSDADHYWSDAYSMPHANLKGTRADGRWWEEHLFDNVRRFFVGGETSINEPVQGQKDRNVCEAIAIERGAETRPEVLELVDVGISPTRPSELWPGVLFFNTLSV